MKQTKLTLSESMAVKSAAVRRIFNISDELAELSVSNDFQALSETDKVYKEALEDEKKVLETAVKKLFYFTSVEL